VSDVLNIDTSLRGELKSSSFLENSEYLRLLALDVNGLADIPDGVKENVYFVLNNADNVARRNTSTCSVFRDDCGVWSSEGTGTPLFYYLLCEDGPPAYIRCLKGVFGKRVKGCFEALTPQLQPEQVLVIRRSYSKLKRDPTYRRRVTWLDRITRNWTKPLAIVEYSGNYPQQSASHGNSVKETEYVRTKPDVVAAVDAELKSSKRPREACHDVNVNNPEAGPRNMQQVYNRKKSLNEKLTQQRPKCNLADDVQAVLGMVQEQQFVRSVVVAGDKPPTVIVYTDQQVADVKRWCCGPRKRCILVIDRTFNLGKCYVTVTTFKYLDVLHNQTNEPPVMLGPCYLHWGGTVATYATFFQHLRLKLSEDIEAGIAVPVSVLIGSDDERALRNALYTVFPNAPHPLCLQHLKRNVEHYLIDIVGQTAAVRRTISTEIFSSLPQLTSDQEYEDAADQLLQNYKYV